jgi:hypothetical protein
LIGSASALPAFQYGDVQIEYHPHSKRGVTVMGREEFKQAVNNAHSMEPPIKELWLPFRSREDFDFADIAHDAAMNQSQIDDLIKLFHRCQQDPGKVTLKNYQDLRRSWDASSKILTNVSNSPLRLSHSPSPRGQCSLNSISSPSSLRVPHASSRPGHAQSGIGSWITL